MAAMVIFRSMEGQKRFLKAYENINNWDIFYRLFNKCYDSTWMDKLKFKDRVLKVEEAVEPELLYW